MRIEDFEKKCKNVIDLLQENGEMPTSKISALMEKTVNYYILLKDILPYLEQKKIIKSRKSGKSTYWSLR